MSSANSFFTIRAKRLVVAAAAAALAIGLSASAVRADTITDANVEAAMTAAKTPADHEALAAYFTGKAKEAQVNIERHQRMSKLFSGKANASWQAHCNNLIKTYEEQVKDYTAMAKEQQAVAAALAK